VRPWNWPPSPSAEEAGRLSARFGMPRPVACTLARRGFRAGDDMEDFLSPRLGRLADPSGLDDMGRAVERVWRAVDAGETIFVHGDYDVDGITGTAFLTRTLRALGAKVVPFVPDRTEGYGISSAGIAAARDAGATVLVTVDNGIRAFAEVEEAAAAGIDVVILDHHEPADRLPAAYAVVDPRRDARSGEFTTVSLKPAPDCPVCGRAAG